MLHHSLERSHASKMSQLLPSRSQLSIHLLLFNMVSYNLPSTDLLNSRWVHRMEFSLPYFKRRVDDWGQVQTPSQYWDSHICVKGEMNLVKRITGMARIIRVTRMQTDIYTGDKPTSVRRTSITLWTLKKRRDAFAICNFKMRMKTI